MPNIISRGAGSARGFGFAGGAAFAQLLLESYNSSTSADITGSFTIPSGANKIVVFGCAGGGAGGYTQTNDNGSAGGAGGAATISGYEIAVSAGQTINYTVGRGGTPVSVASSTQGGSGQNTKLVRSGTTILELGGGTGGSTAGANGPGNSTVLVGTGVSGGGGGDGGQRGSRDGGNGGSVTNGCGGGGGGGAHVSNKTGGTGGSSTITAGPFTYGSITISFTGGSGGGPGTAQSAGDSPPTNIELARGGYATAVDGNTGAGGGAGRGIKPTVNGVAATYFHGGGGGGNRSYVSGITTSYDGRGAGGFLIVVAIA